MEQGGISAASPLLKLRIKWPQINPGDQRWRKLVEDMTPPEERNSDVQPSLLLATVVSASQTSVPEGERHSSHLTLLGRYHL